MSREVLRLAHVDLAAAVASAPLSSQEMNKCLGQYSQDEARFNAFKTSRIAEIEAATAAAAAAAPASGAAASAPAH
jgi:hypothetical protein